MSVLSCTKTALNLNNTSTVPVGSSGTKVVEALTSSPLISRNAFPVSLSIRTPDTVYSLPGLRSE